MEQERKKIVFLSSSLANLSKFLAENNNHLDVFLVLDRRFPYDIEDEELDNFYSYIFDKKKIFEKNKTKYFDSLAIFISDIEPDLIIADNFTKLLPHSFIDFFKFRNSKMKIINLHHGDLRVLDEKRDMKFKGLNSDILEMLDRETITTSIHLIEDEGVDTGEKLAFSYPTTIKELKQKKFFKHKDDIMNLRLRNVAKSYHERSKVLGILEHVIEDLLKE